jgi:hypothetical protein
MGCAGDNGAVQPLKVKEADDRDKLTYLFTAHLAQPQAKLVATTM